MQENLLNRIQNWYQINCNDDWEHSYGFSIETIDNPGWTVSIDLSETPLENLNFERNVDNGRFDWYFIKTADKVFEAHGDPSKLSEILKIFLDEIIPNYADKNFTYEVYIPLIGGPTKIWRPVNARMITEDTLEIINIPELKYQDIKTITLEDITFNEKDIFDYKINISLGDNIKTELIEMFDGVKLIVKENK
ncbi:MULTISPECIES: immunity 53 family protein [Flavobacterium]|uniref:immunity 53 family protein n=1 Tax=Flavobacterium TaxID=237 RepID=UPI001FCA72E6|nr:MULTISPECIES: immunity 53 family protein [Flavobacterium]UOK42181.1 immunity 53 family protein [Flavobacterium enshiense]